jgi:hypothetical protein
MRNHLLTAVTTLLRIGVAVVTVYLAVNMFEHGGWWILWCLMWLPINFIVMAAFGDEGHSGNEVAEAATFGSDE